MGPSATREDPPTFNPEHGGGAVPGYLYRVLGFVLQFHIVYGQSLDRAVQNRLKFVVRGKFKVILEPDTVHIRFRDLALQGDRLTLNGRGFLQRHNDLYRRIWKQSNTQGSRLKGQ